MPRSRNIAVRGTPYMRAGSPILFIICMVTIVATGWLTDNLSCARQQHPREALNHQARVLREALGIRIHSIELHMRTDTGAILAYDKVEVVKLRDARVKIQLVNILSCSKIFPDS